MNTSLWIVGIVNLLVILAQSANAAISAINGDLNALSSKVDNFKVDLHRILEGSRVRKKRQVYGPDGPSEHQMRVESADAEDLSYLSDYKLTFWTSVEYHSRNQVLVGTREGHLILFEISEADDRLGHIVAVSYEEEVATKAKAFTYLDEQWFIVLQSARNQTWIRLYLKVGRGLEKRQSITLEGEADFDFVTVKGVHYMAVTTHQSSRNQASLTLYHWTQTQFDLIATRTVYGPRSIACWVLDGTLYIVLAQRVDGKEEFRYGAPVYLYNAKDNRGLVLQQMLSIYGQVKVLHFYVSSSHYIIFIGSQNAAIYWWSSNQFLLWQVIQNTAHATDAAILVLANGEVMIVIALKEEVLFATLDSSGHYMVSFTMSFSGHSLSSVQFMYSGKAYYALALFATAYIEHAQQTYKLTLNPYFVPTGSSLDSLRQCLNDVAELLEEKQNEMNNIHVDLSRVWLRNQEQKVTAEVFVAGKIISNQSSVVSEILVITDRKILPESSLSEVDSSLARLRSIIRSMQQNIWGSVRKTVPQTITGTKHFHYPVHIPSLNLKSTILDVPINGVPVSKINEHALRITGDQIFKMPVQIATIDGSNIMIENVNGISTSDFLLLKGEQHVSGNLKFINTAVGNLFIDTVNSIPVNHLVTLSGEQTIQNLKSSSHLQSSVINVEGQTNGEILRELLSKVIQTNADDELKGLISIHSASLIKGDVFLTGKINGKIDLRELVENSVTKNTQQNLKGRITFQAPVTSIGNLDIDGYVNGVNINQLLTLTTDQIVGGHLVFENILTVQSDLSVDSVNDVRLKEAAVLRTLEPQFLTGTKTFIQDITADFVDMTDYTTLDGVDPSLLVQDMVMHREGKVKQDHTIFHKVTVLGNLTVMDGINDRNVFDLQDFVWLKTKPQVIEIPVTVKRISLVDDLVVTYINSIDLDEEVVRSFGDETILSVKYFEHNVKVSKAIDVTDGAMINGMDILSFKTELEDYVTEGTVHGKKVLNHLVINGDLNADTLNNFDIFKDMMRPNVYQEVLAPVTFPSELTIIQDTFRSNTVWFNTFNSMNIRSYLEGAISKTKPKQTIKNKTFLKLRARDLSLPNGNTINRIPISWLLNRVVTLNTPQQILAEKTFLSNLKLRTLTTSSLNGKELPALVKKVVFVDGSGLISSKEFLGSFRVPSLLVQQPIYGIDISQLSKNVIYKSEETKIKMPVIFLKDIDVGKLVTAFKIDETDWDDLIFTKQDKSLGSLWLMSDTYVLGNVLVTGLVNGCDLQKLAQRALYSNKTTQLIEEEITLESIEVIGNVKIEDVINEVPVRNLLQKLILVTGNQIVTSDVIIDTGIEVANINIDRIADHLNLNFILTDAVKSSLPQDIRGYKKFHSLTADVLEAANLFVRDKLDTVSLSELFNSIVWKKDHQIINGEKIFATLNADVATIQGRLNGLSLPNDIVKTDTNETITTPIDFMSNLILVEDLFVQGRVDGTDISNLVQNRVTLATNQTVSSRLSFHSHTEIHGDLKVDGTVNDVVLELISKKSMHIPLFGHKVFIKDLQIKGSLNASSLNGFNVPALDHSILKHNEEEFVKDLQIFEKPLKVGSHLFTDWINSISLSGITSSFFNLVSNFNSTLSYLEELSFGFLRQLSGHIDAVGNRISKFAYFILLQEINLGPTVKILQGYRLEHSTSDFSHSMVIWTSQKHCSYLEKCCHEEYTHWMRVKRTGHLMVDSQPEPGRLYPIHNPAPVTTDKDFFIWTNATGYQPKGCNKGRDEKMLLASFTDLQYLEVFMDIRSSPTLSDAKSFRRGYLYAVAGFYYDKKEDVYSSAVVYKFNEMRREWTEHQILPSHGVLSLDITSYFGSTTDELLLAVGTGIGSFSSVYRWNEIEHEFILLKNIPSKYVTSTLWLKHGSIQLLAMANVEEWPSKEAFCSDLVSGGGIDIYTYDTNIRLSQSIPLSGVVSLVYFTLEGDTFLAAASSKLQTVYIYEWRGYSAFTLVQSMFVGEVTHLNTYRIAEDLYMTVATSSGPAKVLKLVMQGRHTVTTVLHKEVSPDDQKDEARKEDKSGC